MSQKKIKIAFIGTNDHPIPAVKGGAIQTLVTALLDQNEQKQIFNFDVYTRYFPEAKTASVKYQSSNFIFIKSSLYAKCHLFFVRALRRITHNRVKYSSIYMRKIIPFLRKNEYDFLIFETTDKEVIQIPEDVKNKSKVLFHVHADYLNDQVDRFKQVVDNTDCFLGVSDFISKKLRESRYISEDKVLTFKNAIDLQSVSDIDKNNAVRKSIRQKLGIIESDVIVVFCGRLSPEKGCLELIKAMGKVHNAKLLVLGGNDFSSNKRTSYVSKLYDAADKIAGKVLFTGYIPHDEVLDYMKAADIGVVPSVCNESCSLTLLEYRSIGLPTIASNLGGIPEYCTSSSTVLVNYDSDFETSIANAINELSLSVEERSSMGINATRNIEEFGYPAYYLRFCDMIEVLNKKL